MPKLTESETVAFSRCLKSAPVIGNSKCVQFSLRMFQLVLKCVPSLLFENIMFHHWSTSCEITNQIPMVQTT